MSRVDLWLDAEDIASAAVSGGYDFIIPDDAVRKGNLDDPKDDKARASWAQTLAITESKFYEDTTKDSPPLECITAEITFQVPPNALRPDGKADPNAGKQHRVWYRIIPAALKSKDHPKYKANNFALGKLNSIVRGIWGSAVFPSGSKVNLGDYYGGDNPAVVGNEIATTMRASKWNDKRRDELADIVPLEAR